MSLRLILPAAAASLILATSCTPYVEPPPPAPTDPAERKRTPEEEEKLRKQREEMKKKDEEAKPRDRDRERKSEGDREAVVKPGGEDDEPKPQVNPTPDIPVARPIPGKPGMVFSPFNNKPIDVKGIPSGRLVADPTFPASEKKHFRVP